MAKFVGIQNNEIKLVSNSKVVHGDMQILELPQELSHLTANELIANFKFRNGELVSKQSKKPIEKIKLALVGRSEERRVGKECRL